MVGLITFLLILIATESSESINSRRPFRGCLPRSTQPVPKNLGEILHCLNLDRPPNQNRELEDSPQLCEGALNPDHSYE